MGISARITTMLRGSSYRIGVTLLWQHAMKQYFKLRQMLFSKIVKSGFANLGQIWTAPETFPPTTINCFFQHRPSCTYIFLLLHCVCLPWFWPQLVLFSCKTTTYFILKPKPQQSDCTYLQFKRYKVYVSTAPEELTCVRVAPYYRSHTIRASAVHPYFLQIQFQSYFERGELLR